MTMPQASNPAYSAPERTQRPWGWYETISEAAGHKVKRIHVNAGQRLSLQKHAQRAEHWVVVHGQARITLGNPDGETWRELDLGLGQHCDIALGQVHRLASVGSEPVEIIEVQFGAYLGEDDITRLQDDFGRI
jgi:mannose-6-phosphate isomerase